MNCLSAPSQDCNSNKQNLLNSLCSTPGVLFSSLLTLVPSAIFFKLVNLQCLNKNIFDLTFSDKNCKSIIVPLTSGAIIISGLIFSRLRAAATIPTEGSKVSYEKALLSPKTVAIEETIKHYLYSEVNALKVTSIALAILTAISLIGSVAIAALGSQKGDENLENSGYEFTPYFLGNVVALAGGYGLKIAFDILLLWMSDLSLSCKKGKKKLILDEDITENFAV